MQELSLAVAVRLHNSWFRARDEESGQGLVEYALIVAVISLGLIAALTFLKSSVTNLFSKAGNGVSQVSVG